MLNEQKVVPKLRQDVKVKVDIVTSDDINIYYTGIFKDFTARYLINKCITSFCNTDQLYAYKLRPGKRGILASLKPFTP